MQLNPGVCASLCHDRFTAEIARAHNLANVLVMGATVVVPALAERIETGSSQLRVYWGLACRWPGRGRGLPMMGVLTLPTGKTSTCLTLPSLALT